MQNAFIFQNSVSLLVESLETSAHAFLPVWVILRGISKVTDHDQNGKDKTKKAR